MTPQRLSKLQNSAPRIEPLAVLPVFLNLHGKKAFAIGHSIGAPALMKWITMFPPIY